MEILQGDSEIDKPNILEKKIHVVKATQLSAGSRIEEGFFFAKLRSSVA